MIYATIALILKAVLTCAAPVFAFLLVEGVHRTSSMRKYFLRVLGLAVLTEVPYNLAMSGNVLDSSGRNPVFGLLVSLTVLYFYRRYSEHSGSHLFIKIAVTAAGLAWCWILRVEDGICLLILSAVLWWFYDKKMYRLFSGVIAAVVCSIFSPFYLASPMSFLVLHFYNGEKDKGNRFLRYLAYPAVLLLCWAASVLFF